MINDEWINSFGWSIKLPVSPFNIPVHIGSSVPSKPKKQKYLRGVVTANNELKL
jgi:hypothetical protein